MPNDLLRPLMHLPVRVAILARGCSMSSPARVSNTSMGLESLRHIGLGFLNKLLQFRDLTNFLEGANFILFVTVHRKACRVVTAVFKSGESCISYCKIAIRANGGKPIPLSNVSMMYLRSLSTR